MRPFPVPPEARRVAAAATAAAYLAACPTLAVLAVMLGRAYCEGFGCIGKGLAWVAWSAGYLLVLAVGVVAWRTHRGPGRAAVRYGLIAQLLVGAALVVYRAARTAA